MHKVDCFCSVSLLVSPQPRHCFLPNKRALTRQSIKRESYRDSRNQSPSLDAFYVGRAIAQVLRESLGGGLIDLLSELARQDAIFSKQLREFQDAVFARVNDRVPSAQQRQSSTSNNNLSLRPSYGSRGRSSQPITPDTPLDQLEHGSLLALQEAVDDLRAEVAFARSVLQAYKRTTVQGILEANFIKSGTLESRVGRFKTSGIGLSSKK